MTEIICRLKGVKYIKKNRKRPDRCCHYSFHGSFRYRRCIGIGKSSAGSDRVSADGDTGSSAAGSDPGTDGGSTADSSSGTDGGGTADSDP